MNDFRPVPKPPVKKKRKLYNGYKDKPNRYCCYTGEPGAERHEVFGGPNREISIRYGFQLDLSPEIHRRFHNPETVEDCDRILFWREHFQKRFEREMVESGMMPQSAREAWIMLIGKNYVPEKLG